jgi:hypothetical protein
MIVEREGTIYHDEHNYDIKISNDNTKGERRVSIHVRMDCCADEAVDLANKLFDKAMGNPPGHTTGAEVK